MVKAKILRKAQIDTIIGYLGILILILGIVGTLAKIAMALGKGPEALVGALPKATASTTVTAGGVSVTVSA